MPTHGTVPRAKMGKIQVLLVDDEQEYVENLSERMALDGIDSKVAFTAEEGLVALENDPPDVLVLDLRMPGMGGMELLDRVRKDHPGTQVIILTGQGGKAAELEAQDRGAFAYLEKPVDYGGLKAVINRAWSLTKRVSHAVADDIRLSFFGDMPKGDQSKEDPVPHTPAKIPKEGLRVLLVDDEEDYVRSLAERMELRDLPSHTAISGKEALSIVGNDPPDVMVLDLNMPGMGGMEVLRRVKTEHPQTEVIILTGHGSPAEREEAIRLGAADYLNKPVEVQTLMMSVRTAGQKAEPNGPGEGSK